MDFFKPKLFTVQLFTIGVHSLFWIFFIFIPHVLFGFPLDAHILGYKLLETGTLAIVFYTNAYYLVPTLLLKKKYLLYFIVAIALVLVFMQGGRAIKPPQMPQEQAFQIERVEKSERFERRQIRMQKKRANFMGLAVLIALAVSASYGYAQQYNIREKKLKELEKEQFASELLFLKNQINPHFLFNVLNSIYSLTLKKSDKAPQAILQLSDMLRYITYESEEKFVDIHKEVQYIQNYIDLQKLRLAPESDVHFTCNDTGSNATIAPMILLPFIENAFKHGVSSHGVLSMHCSVSISPNQIRFTVINNYDAGVQKDQNHGIGIQNVKRRLELLYTDAYELHIQTNDNKYDVSLTLNTNI